MEIVDPFDNQIVDPFDVPKVAGPELRQGTPPSTWESITETIGRVFEDPEKEGARAVKNIVDAQALKISPSEARRYEDAIDRGMKINPLSVAASSRTRLMDRVNQSWEIGKKQNQAAELANKFVQHGDWKALEEAQAIKYPGKDEEFIPESFLEDAVRSAAKMLPMMFDVGTEGAKRGATLGMAFGGVAALAGQAGPQVALPEELLTVPAATAMGFKIGATQGAFEASVRKEAGLAVLDILKIGQDQKTPVDPNIARASAFGIGILNGALEVAEIKILLKTIPGMDKVLSDSIMKAITSKTVRDKLRALPGKYVGTVLKETAVEAAQESTNIVGEEISRQVNNALKGTDIPPAKAKDILSRLVETAKDAAKGFSVMAAPGTVISGAQTITEGKKDKVAPVQKIFNDALTQAINAGVPVPEAVKEATKTAQAFADTVVEEPAVMANEPAPLDDAEADEVLDTVFSGEQNAEDVIYEEGEYDTQPGETAEVTEEGIVTPSPEAKVQPQGEFGSMGGEGTTVADSQTIIDSVRAINASIGEKGTVDLAPLVELGKVVWNEGKVKFEDFSARVKEYVGDLWDKVKEFVQAAYDKIKEERGSISYENRPEGVKEVGRYKFILDALKQQTGIKRGKGKANFTESDFQNYLKEYYPSLAGMGKSGILTALGNVTNGKKLSEGQKEIIRLLDEEEQNLIDQYGPLDEKPYDTDFVAEYEPKSAYASPFMRRKLVNDLQAKKRINEVTGVNKESKAVREDTALKAGFKQAERYSRLAFREGVKAGVEKAGQVKQETVKQRVRRITGQTTIGQMIGEDEALRAAFKKAEQAGRIAYREGNKAGMAEQKAIMKELINRAREKSLQRTQIKNDINAIKQMAKPGKSVAVEFQKAIKDLVKGLDFKKMTEAKFNELQELSRMIEETGSTIGIPEQRIKELSRLSKTAIADMTPENIAELRAQIEHLTELGKLMAEMKLKYKEEARDKAIDEITRTTINLDPHVALNEDGTWDKVKVAAVSAYINTLHTPRVAELADNFKKDGIQQAYIKRMGEAETDAVASAIDRETAIMEKIHALGVGTIEEGSESDVKMRIVMAYREGSTTQAETLMEHYGYNSVPELNEKEEAILEIIRQDMASNKAALAAVWEDTKGEIFPERPVYYLPMKYVKDEELVPDPQVQGRGRTTHTFEGMGKPRLPGVNKLPRVGVLELFREAVLEQEWFKSIQPVIEDIKSVVASKEYKEAAGDIMSGWWKDQIDIMARRGWSASAQMNALTNLARRFRHNINTAVLGFKASTIMLQSFAVLDGMAYVNSKIGAQAAGRVLSQVMKTLLIPGQAKKIISKSNALKQRKGGELAITEELIRAQGGSLKDKATRTAFKWITEADIRTAAGVQEAVRQIFVEEGMSEQEALKEAEYVMHLSQGSASIAYRPHILASGEGARLLFTFQTFIMNRWGIIAHDLITGKIAKGEAKEKMMGLISLGILMLAGANEDDAREWMYEKISGKELKADNRSLVEKTLVNLASTMPAFGSIINYISFGMDPDPPAIRTGKNLFKGLYKMAKGSELDKKFKGFMQALESGLILSVGFPGTAQFFDLLERFLFSKGDKR